MSESSNPKATIGCPICGKDTPHHHTAIDAGIFAEHQKALAASTANSSDRWLNGKMCGLAAALDVIRAAAKTGGA